MANGCFVAVASPAGVGHQQPLAQTPESGRSSDVSEPVFATQA
jgi:hypothetical protein